MNIPVLYQLWKGQHVDGRLTWNGLSQAYLALARIAEIPLHASGACSPEPRHAPGCWLRRLVGGRS